MEDRRSPSRVQPASTKGRGPTPAAPKLRDSCHACAASKLKCNKEKPTCARCAKRGITCEYLATKRGGRKHTNRNTNSTTDSNRASPSNTAPPPPQPLNVTQFMPPRTTWFTAATSVPGTVAHGSPIPIQTSPRPSSTAIDIPPPMLSPVDHPMSGSITDLTTDLDEFFATPNSFSIPELSDTDILSQSHFFPTPLDSGTGSNITSNNSSENLFENFHLFQDGIPDFPAFSKPSSISDNQGSPFDAQSSNTSTRGTDSLCYCLVRALGLMKQLFPNPTSNFTSAMEDVDQQQQQLNISPPSIQTVISKNQDTIEAISTMLNCSCAHDGYLLTIMSLIVFKVLGWYAAAAAPKAVSTDDDNSGLSTPSTSHSRKLSHSEMVIQDATVVGSYCLEGADADRMAAQLVLSELHRVQRLVNQLSAKLKLQIAHETRLNSESSSHGSSYKSDESDLTVPLSAVTLDQIIVDLRKRLRALSVNIAEGLRSH
ncbi:C6 transcription factor [Talaromyces pinophilus]|uniref:C6 transcription factor n=1 Tax=Talaromyces pinophilus TaxID=128442 RepID=A0A698XPS4_TALPI|nr:C6 transcription factor [Talaromyces pinophilus]